MWDWLRRLLGPVKEDGELEVKNVRQVGDIQIGVSTGLSGTRDVKVSAWNLDMAHDLFWKVWDGLSERERH